MSPEPTTADTNAAFDEAISGIASCALDEAGVREQRDRYARLAPSVERLKREPEAVVIEFAEGFDQALLDETLAVERACCPMFVFEFDESERRLRTTVRDADQLSALDAMEHSLSAAGRATPRS